MGEIGGVPNTPGRGDWIHYEEEEEGEDEEGHEDEPAPTLAKPSSASGRSSIRRGLAISGEMEDEELAAERAASPL